MLGTSAGAAWHSGDVNGQGETALYCAPWDEWGGYTDAHKLELSRGMYVKRWGRTPGPEFDAAVKWRNPCKAAHAAQLVEKYKGR